MRNKVILHMAVGDGAVGKRPGEPGGASAVLGARGALTARAARTGLAEKVASQQSSRGGTSQERPRGGGEPAP